MLRGVVRVVPFKILRRGGREPKKKGGGGHPKNMWEGGSVKKNMGGGQRNFPGSKKSFVLVRH